MTELVVSFMGAGHLLVYQPSTGGGINLTAKEARELIELLASYIPYVGPTPPRPDTQSDATLIELEEKVHFWQGEAEKWMKTVQSIDRTPPPDASAGLIEAAEIADDWSRADRIHLALGELTASEMRIAQAVVGQLAESIRRAADKSGK